MPDRDYSHRTLIEKLGVQNGHRVASVNICDSNFLELVADAAGKAPEVRIRGAFDIIFLQVNGPSDLREIPKVKKHLKPAGALWILHPKGKNAAVRDAQVRAAYLDCGLVDNKVSAYSDSHTATRCVVPRNRRP